MMGMYAFYYEFPTEEDVIKSKTVFMDPILRVLMATDTELYNNFKKWNCKLGHYYVEITETEPELNHIKVSPPKGIKLNMTYAYYCSKIIDKYAPVIIPPSKIIHQPTQCIKPNRQHRRSHLSKKIEDYDEDEDEVCVGSFTETLINLPEVKIIRPSIPPIIYVEDYVKLIVNTPPIVITPTYKPLNIVFKSNIINNTVIQNMLTECYTQNDNFRNQCNQYTSILVIKDIHKDMNRLEISRHFNCIFRTIDYDSSVYHIYIDSSNTKILSITAIINIL
tara:strand:+ start:125 stop:958 length:834 start_codon:yes stop_codon:yes gene_type:complete